jgi:hypothetical protein
MFAAWALTESLEPQANVINITNEKTHLVVEPRLFLCAMYFQRQLKTRFLIVRFKLVQACVSAIRALVIF